MSVSTIDAVLCCFQYVKAKFFIHCMPTDICIHIVDLAILYAVGDSTVTSLLPCSEVSVVVAASEVVCSIQAFEQWMCCAAYVV